MGRPDTPRVNRLAAVRAAIDIIGNEGLEAFSMPRLAAECGVKVPSLYHHFRDRDDVLMAVVRHVAGSAVATSGLAPGPDWPEHFVALAINFRSSFERYPNIAPLLLRYRPRDLVPGGYEAAATFLSRSGVPVEQHIQILDGLETLLIGTALCEILYPLVDSATGYRLAGGDSRPALMAAVRACDMSAEALLKAKVMALLVGISNERNKCRPINLKA